jgi:hypothetical protein
MGKTKYSAFNTNRDKIDGPILGSNKSRHG